MATLHSSTPPPPSSIHTPTTPRFGFGDNYQPYSPRKSTRVSRQARSANTPPPQSGLRTNTPRTSKKRASTDSSDTPSSPLSPQTATKKRTPRQPYTMAGRRVSGALNAESTSSAAAALGLPQPKIEQHRATAVVRHNGMLPTPDKTPKKTLTEIAPAITSIARNLFPARETVDEAMPSPKKKGRKKHSGFTLDSFDDEDETPIQIFTDSNDRVPEADNSLDNPFYGEGSMTQPEPVKRSSKRQKISIPGEDDQTLEEAEKRKDGLVYVFRGKKLFRKFVDEDDGAMNQHEEDAEDAVLEDSLPSRLRAPTTRSSMKPRLLFPTPQWARAMEAESHNTEDEEADTDIEEFIKGASTPLGQVDDMASTPKAPRFVPASPPTTARATRSKKIDLSSSPPAPGSDDGVHTPTSQQTRGEKISPFGMWQRKKAQESNTSSTSRKRQGSLLMSGGDKKLRR